MGVPKRCGRQHSSRSHDSRVSEFVKRCKDCDKCRNKMCKRMRYEGGFEYGILGAIRLRIRSVSLTSVQHSKCQARFALAIIQGLSAFR